MPDSGSILVMQTAPGTDYQTLLRQHGRDPATLNRARELYMSAFQLWMEKAFQPGSGFVHGDPHLGNLFYCSGGPLTFIDFGNAAIVPDNYNLPAQLKIFLLGAVQADADMVLEAFPLSIRRATAVFKKQFAEEMSDFSAQQYLKVIGQVRRVTAYEWKAWRAAFAVVVKFQAFGTAPTVLYVFIRAMIMQWEEGWEALHDPEIYYTGEEEERNAETDGIVAELANAKRPRGPLDVMKVRLLSKVNLMEGAGLLMRGMVGQRPAASDGIAGAEGLQDATG
eukprot:gnl/TRDRNA2_/TRDRNA2_48841_c0_seq1.p1 gnl/TRDRNA2_/TRDRNA2_48841_c0~~gnl/TRDRNA2_/TRDRNA2_48841_c0_seq1.p1  ORF type:complete len:287 (+),score=45.78 gnl/TRDRNA2_/TRDRNA2_48841_c0_seq1:22-861(+)